MTETTVLEKPSLEVAQTTYSTSPKRMFSTTKSEVKKF